MNGVAVEPSSHLARNPTYTSRTRAWDLASSPSTAITKYHCTLTSGPWSISPNGLRMCCLAMKQGVEEVEDLFLSRYDYSTPQKCTPCNLPGGMSEYRRIYPQGCPFSRDGSMVASIRRSRWSPPPVNHRYPKRKDHLFGESDQSLLWLPRSCRR
ncbi:hypothetical protein OS493_034696 [Desmophyllum pertusum]|uniref:Uncharacterized protein n=1 Tax=Desmophyllum pertusum TaxID=174260 RepID=A0A9W9ZAB3_9CNID|nr:hypothetical protein OS493_034696 [Desmophyllum pertusum]